jgi:hypothetical protein
VLGQDLLLMSGGSTVPIAGVAAPSCAAWDGQTCATDNDYDTLTDLFSQRLSTTGGTVCEVKAKLYKNSGNADIHVEFWSGGDRTGTQYGGNSNTNTVSSTDTANVETFTWTATKPTLPSGSCYMFFVGATGTTTRFRCYTVAGGTGYSDTTYAMYSNGTLYGSGTYDFYFVLSKE